MPVLDRAVGLLGLAFALAIVVRVILVRRVIHRSPVVVGRGGTAHDRLHAILALVIVLEALSIVLFRLRAYVPSLDYYGVLLPLAFLRQPVIEGLGLVIATAGLLLAVTAQTQMGVNWRVGNDETGETALVREGLYRYSRNPIYVGFIAISTGLFLAMPNLATLFCAVVNPVALIWIVKLEEEFQRTRHGAAFDAYAARVPRWLW